MNQEIIELLEKAETKLLCTDDRLRPLGDIQQALALLKPPECALCCDKKVVTRLYYEKVPCPDCQPKAGEPKCKTCGDTGKVSKPMPTEPHPCNYVNLKRAERTISCPDCQQPTAGEFTTKWRHTITGGYPNISGKLTQISGDKILEACDIIDRTGAENKRLKKAIEDYGNNPAGFDWAVLEKIENQESINADLLAACERALRFGLNPSLEKIVQAAIAKAKQ